MLPCCAGLVSTQYGEIRRTILHDFSAFTTNHKIRWNQGFLKTPVSLDCLLKLLFERSGARLETATQVVYWVNTTGLSVSYHRLLAAVADGLCAMDLREQGKPLHVRLKTMPP